MDRGEVNKPRMIDSLSKDEVKHYFNSLEGVKKFVSIYFYDEEGNDLILTDYQARIVQMVVLKYPQRILLWATTRAGKSYALAIGAVLTGILRPNEKIRIVAPTKEKAKTIMNYIQKKIDDHPDILKTVHAKRKYKTRPEKLKEELSQTRITFENNSEISILSANIKGGGRSLLGEGGSFIIVDEAEHIPRKIMRLRLERMVAEKPNSQIFLVSNPTMPNNRGYMYFQREKDKKRDEPIWTKIRIGWEKTVEEGRLTKEFIEKQKDILTPAEFKVMYEAKYPDEVEGGLMNSNWMENSIDKEFELPNTYDTRYGLDVAEEGEDKTVLTKLHTWTDDEEEDYFKVDEIHTWDIPNTKTQVKRIRSMLDEGSKINVDTIGVGKNVADDLDDMGFEVNQIKVSKSCEDEEDRDRYDSRKAKYFWEMRNAFEDGRVDIPNHKQLKNELSSMMYDYTKRGKIKILDPSKSPDHADSLILGMVQESGNDIPIAMV